MSLSKIQKSFLDKMNKILSSRDLVLVASCRGVGFGFLSHGDDDKANCSDWETLDQAFFESQNQEYLTVFKFFKMLENAHKGLSFPETGNMPYVIFRDLGLMDLETCASYEEMLIRLEIMFPEV